VDKQGNTTRHCDTKPHASTPLTNLITINNNNPTNREIMFYYFGNSDYMC